MSPRAAPPLPIDAVLSDLADALAGGSRAVLVAPPGAGKTTRVPLALLEAGWLGDGKIILLEPRRLAARAAAERMAATLGERVGETVGLRVRLGSKVSARTRIEVVTEGVFTRMILDDPELAKVGAVLFDEFHERSLDADLGLALALDAQGGLREDLRILVMSATLDGARVAGLLGGAPVIASEGRAYPVETRYVERDPNRRVEETVTDVILRALRADPGSVLAFLPGQAEIRRVAEALDPRVGPDTDIALLYGALSPAEQDRAVSPALPGRRKVVLATSIAETSLTIEGVRIVVDSGLARVPHYEPGLGLTRLVTARASRASADQRRGRAGRTEPGICWRLWSEAATGALDPFTRPEILAADLAGLVLDCAAWGEADPTRLARMVVRAAETGQARHAADLAALLVERGLGGDAPDLGARLDRFRSDRGQRASDMRRLAGNWAKLAGGSAASEPSEPGPLLALAYPDRIARARGREGEFVMGNGRAGRLDPAAALAREPFIVVADLAGTAGNARILAAAPITLEAIEAAFAERIESVSQVSFDPAARALRARALRRLGALNLGERTLPVPPDLASAEILARGIVGLGLDRLPWSAHQRQMLARIRFLRAAEGEPWPDLSDEGLAASVEEWFAPAIVGRTSLDAIGADDLGQALAALLPWDLRGRIDNAAPTHVEVPTGSRIPVDYEAEGGPALAVRVQELFGLDTHPRAGGIPLVLNLLSPAQRPIQITRDLPGFWRGSWAAVRSEMRGRYPRHPWPEDPLAEAPTRRAKPRGT